MAEQQHYDLISLGSGEAGKYIAWTYASTQNKKCAVIERSMLGGSCPNVACLPSKNFIYSAKVAHLVGRGEEFGLASSASQVDMKKVLARKDRMMEGLMDLHRANFSKTGVEVIWGDGKFVGKKRIEVVDADGEKRVLTADTIVVSTGSRARIPDDIPGLKKALPLTHVDILNLQSAPQHLIILGGGYIGLEFAQAFRRFGSQVTVVERNKKILKNEDIDVSAFLEQTLTREGVAFCTKTTVNKVSGVSGDHVTLSCNQYGQDIILGGTHILCATGRQPNTDNIGLDIAGIKTTQQGHVIVDEHNNTSAEGMFAVGDCAGSPQFTHVGFDDFRIVRDVLANKSDTSAERRSVRQVPFTLFTDPEVAHVGLREREARSQGIPYRLAKIPMGAFLRTRTLEEGGSDGFAKALVSHEDDTILGFTAVGPHAGELLPVVQLAMKRGLPYTDIADLVITHPTMGEGLVALFSAVPPKD